LIAHGEINQLVEIRCAKLVIHFYLPDKCLDYEKRFHCLKSFDDTMVTGKSHVVLTRKSLEVALLYRAQLNGHNKPIPEWVETMVCPESGIDHFVYSRRPHFFLVLF